MERETDVLDPWVVLWLDAVTEHSMTQRSLASVERHASLETLRHAARERGIHLLRLTDERGRELIAASRRPFTVLC